jgi:MFS family permease
MSSCIPRVQVSRQSPAYRLLGYAVLMLFVGTTIPTPLYRVYQTKLGFSSGVLTLLFAVYVFALLPLLMVVGRISDRIGRRPPLLAGFAAAAGGSALFAAGDGLASLFVARILQGIATGLIAPTATAALAELQPARDTGKAAYLATAANVGGAAIGPAFGGVLAQYAPWPTVLPYLAHLLLMLPVIGLSAMPETVTARRPFKFEPRRPQVPREILREFRLSAAVSFTVWAATALYLTLAPSYVAKLLGLANLAAGGGIVCLMLGASALAQTALRRLPPRIGMATGLGALIPGLGGVVLAAPLHSASLLFAATLVVGLGQGLAYVGSLTLLNGIAPEQRRGDVTAAFYVVTYVGVAVPVIGVGFGAQVIGLFAAVAVFAALVGASALVLVVTTVHEMARSRDQR